MKELFVFSPQEQGGLGVKNPLDQLRIFRYRLFAKTVISDFNEYMLSTVADNMLKFVLGNQRPSSAFYRNVREHLASWKLKPACMVPAKISDWPLSEFFLSPGEAAVLISHNIHRFGILMDDTALLAILAEVPSHKRRSLVRSIPTFKDKIVQFQHNPKADDPHFQAHDVLLEKDEVITPRNSYRICYWRRILPSCSVTDLAKAKSTHWKPLKLCLSPRELDISWRVRHGAISTPQLAYRMGLRPNYNCFFCYAYRPNLRHLLVCPHFDRMWTVVQAVAEESGATWNRRKIFAGYLLGECGILNHIIHAGYLVVHESITFAMNSVSCNHDPVKRWKQIMFDMLYCDFKSKCYDEISILRFNTYWRKLDFLYKICGRSIDIRIPSSFTS